MAVDMWDICNGVVQRRMTGAASLAEAAREEPPNGAYLVTRTWNGGGVLDLDSHFDRMERSAAALGMDVVVPRFPLRALVAEARRGASREIRFRISVLPPRDGTGDPWYRVTAEVAAPVPQEILENGARCRVVPRGARQDAAVKSTTWMHARGTLGDREDVYEYLLADDRGYILEGASSNFFGVRNGVLYTAGDGVLQGIARKTVLSVAPDVLPVVLEAIHQREVPQISEAFITSATRGVVPIGWVDGERMNAPVPGPCTAEIGARWNRWVEEHLEPLEPMEPMEPLEPSPPPVARENE